MRAYLRWAVAASALLTVGCTRSEQAAPTDPLLAQTAATARAVALTPPTPTPATILPGVMRPVSTATSVPPPTRAAASARPPAPTAQVSPPSPPSVLASPTAAPPTPTVGPPTPSPTAGTVFRRDRPIVYAAVGASDTVGVGAPDPARDGWVPQLHRRLPPGSKLVNLGISGARLSDALEKELPKAVEARPDFVTIWNVVNDLNANVDLAAYERDLDRMLAELTGKTAAQVMVGNCPDLTRVPAYARLGIPPEQLRNEVARWNRAIARSVGKYPNRVHIVDLYARSGELDFDPGLVSLDDFHPSAKGYTRLADVFWEFATAARLFPPG